MRYFLSLVSLLSVSVAAFSSSQSALLNAPLIGPDALEVPGENTLSYCKDPKANDYIFDIEYVNLTPNPPVPGQNLTIEAAGTSAQTIEEGAKLFIQVKLGFISIIRKEYDFCDTIDVVDLSCPLEKGYRTIKKVVALPAQIPPGKYSVNANAYTADHAQDITCLEGSIAF